MRRLIIILFTILFLLTGVPTSAYAQESAEGTINGQVINGTEGGGSVAGVEVTLITYINNTLADTTSVRTDDEGKFRFDGINLEHEYIITTKYMDVDYYYPVEFEPGAATAYVEVWVCDVTDSDQAISIGMAHTVINVAEDSLEITAVYWLVNDGDMTYVGTDGALVFTLPEGVYSFEAPQELMPDYQLLEDNRIAYLVPFPPGERQLVYAYSLAKPEAAEYSIPLKVDYHTDSLELMISGEDIEIAVTQLAPADPVVTDTGERFIHFQGRNLPRDTMINLRLSSLSGGSGFPLIIPLVVLTAVIIGLVVYIMISRKRRAGGSE
jgi:hypothetical protein